MLRQWVSADDGLTPRVGALVIEPMQNLAGYRCFSQKFSSALTECCKRNGIFLIADEIFTGFGRCGDWTISRANGLDPDIICVGKAMTGGVPGGACVAHRDVLRLLFPENGAPLHAPTFYCSPLLNASILASIKCIQEGSLLERATQIGKSILSCLTPYVGKVASLIQLRGKGAAQALVFGDSPRGLTPHQTAVAFCQRLLHAGVFALYSGFPAGNVVTLCPPLVIPDLELRLALDRIEEVLHRWISDEY